MLWICIGFNADPDPAFYLKAHPVRGAKPMWIHANLDPDSGQTLPLQKGEFLNEKYTLCG
jgi:hypothetical protein